MESNNNEAVWTIMRDGKLEEPPISIFEDEEDDTPFLYLLPPPILHILLGIANDAMTKMQEIFEDEMLEFLKKGKFKRGDTPGKNYTGKVLRSILTKQGKHGQVGENVAPSW